MQIGKSKIDGSMVEQGVWTKFIVRDVEGVTHEIELRVALSDVDLNKKYKAAMRKAMEPHSRVLALLGSNKGAGLPESVSAQINADGRRCFVENIITGWKGPTDAKGEPLACTPENLEMLFDEFPELYNSVEAEARKIENYRVAATEAQAGN